MPARPDARLVLFEGTATLQCGGRLEAVLGSRQQSLLRRLDSRTADATGEEDKRRIFAAIESLPGGHAAFDTKLQTALRRWLAGAAEGVVDRTDPNRPPLGHAAMALLLAEIEQSEQNRDPD